jgi:hypothetical protein
VNTVQVNTAPVNTAQDRRPNVVRGATTIANLPCGATSTRLPDTTRPPVATRPAVAMRRLQGAPPLPAACSA